MASKKPNKSGADATRVAAAQLRARQKAAVRRRSAFMIAGAVALAAIFVVAIMFILKSSNAANAKYSVYDSGELKVPSAADASGGILIGPGGVVGAEVNADAIRVDIYEDPICPFCGLFSESTEQEIGVLLDAGEIAVYYHPIAFFDYQSKGTSYSTRAVSAFATVAEYDPESLYDFVHLLMSEPIQPEEQTKGLTNDKIAEVAADAGVSAEAIAKIADGEFTRWVAQATEQASIDEVTGTPAVFIDGVFFGTAWMTSGNLSVAVGIVKEYGPDALVASLAGETPLEPSPTPSPAAS